MTRVLFTLLAGAVLAAGLDAGPKPKKSVRYATSWDDAVEEAKALNVPLIVHRHGFYWPPCWTMHRSVLQNDTYIKFANKHTVEVIAMEETDRAVAEKSSHLKTYTVKDPYGDKIEMLLEFPGLTLAQLKDLSDGAAINFMEGGKIPYTAIVNPHNLKEMQAFKGLRKARELMTAITAQRKVLTVKYGQGVDRALWNRISEGEVQVDLKLGRDDVVGALGVWRHLARATVRQPEAVRLRVNAIRDVVLEDAGKRLDEIGRLLAAGQDTKKAKRELSVLIRALDGTPLAERAAALAADKEKK